MGTINYGRQIIRFKYSQPATSETFNHLLYNIMPTGVYSGGKLTKVSNSSVKLSKLICFIKDSSFTYEESSDLYDITAQGIATLIETTEEIDISISAANPYIVLNLDWANATNNYMDIYAKSKSWIDSNPDALVIGRAIYHAGVMDTTFDYTLRDDAPLEELDNVRDYFKVIPTEPISDQIKITTGKFKSNNDIIDFSESTSTAISDTVADPRIDIVYIDSDGDIQIEEGTPSATPTAPDYKGRFVIAEISREAGRNAVAGNEITQVYNRYIPETIQEITYENGYEFYGSKTLKGYTDCSDIFTVCTQGTGNRAIFGHATNCGVYGCATGNMGVYGRATGNMGVYGHAACCGVYGCATSNCGVYGQASYYGIYGCAASNYGVYGRANDCGVFGRASCYGVYGCATSNCGVFGCATNNYGVYGCATTYGVYGYATGNYGVCGRATCYGVYGCATNNCGVYGYAANNFGVYGCATYMGVYGWATECCGVYGRSDYYGVYGYAANNFGVYGCATCCGVYGYATSNCGVYGRADHYGVFGYATGDIGVYGCADHYGVYGYATENSGVYGTASCCGVYGYADTCLGVWGCASSRSVGGNTAYYTSSNKYQKISNKNICILDCLRNNPISVNQWIWEDSNSRSFDEFIHPYSQDIKDTFDLTFEDDGLYTIDGIAFAIGQELLHEVDKLKEEVQELKEQIKYGN